jgi:hypothetical protein
MIGAISKRQEAFSTESVVDDEGDKFSKHVPTTEFLNASR